MEVDEGSWRAILDEAGAQQVRQVRRVARRWSPGLPALLAGLVLVERLLLTVLGSPAMLLGTLADLDDTRTEAVAAVLALLGLLAEVLAGYVLVRAGARVGLHAAWSDGPARRPTGVAGHPGRGPTPARLARRRRAARPGDPGGAPSTPTGDRRGGPQLIATAFPQLSRSDAGHLGAGRCHGGGRWTSRNRSTCGPPPPVSGATAALAGAGCPPQHQATWLWRATRCGTSR